MRLVHRLLLTCIGCCALSVASAPARAALVDCTKPSSIVIDRQVCDDPSLSRSIQASTRSFDETSRGLAVRERSLLRTAERLWRVKLHDCVNADPATGRDRDLERCVPAVLDAYADYLRQAKADPRSIVEHLADFDLIDVRYLALHADRYLGRSVRVMGSLRMDHCGDSYAGNGLGHLSDGRRSFAIRFDGLSDGQWDFLCTKSPSSSWAGVVRAAGTGYLLVASDLLGNPLAGTKR